MEADAMLGWRPRKNFSFSYKHPRMKKNVEVFQDAEGYRTPHLANLRRGATPSPFILYFGETNLVGWELERDETLSAQLEDALRTSGRGMAVLPIAVRNYSLGQLFALYMSDFAQLQPAAVLYQ